ncbi:MAG TPA: hypothetical protein VGY56_11250 [Verrucomicrobiae bacterium]|nr:hypothetical protein [Verrucomicrobiae bacterium]
MKKALLLLAVLAMFDTGCMSARIRPGRTQASTGDGTAASAIQSQDPNTPTTQQIETDTSTTQTLPAGSIVESGSSTNISRTILSEPATQSSTTHKLITTSVGASQKNTAQDIAAKLASIRWLQWVGVILVLFGGASLFYPPLKAIINSVTTSVWCISAGGAMIFLPLIIVGHEMLILGIGGGVILLWFLAHRHGSVTAELSTLKGLVTGGQPTKTATGTATAAPVTPAPATSTPASTTSAAS